MHIGKKLFIRIAFTNIILILLLLGYYNTPYSLKSHSWKSMHSCDMPDFIKLNDKTLDWPVIYNSEGDTIGTILFCYQDNLTVKSATGCVGEYCAK